MASQCKLISNIAGTISKSNLVKVRTWRGCQYVR